MSHRRTKPPKRQDILLFGKAWEASAHEAPARALPVPSKAHQLGNEHTAPAPPVAIVASGPYGTHRHRAHELRARMAVFSAIYNAAYMIRVSYFGIDEHRHEKVMHFIAVMLQEMRQTQDFEALLYAIADALYASPLGVPWEA